MAVKWRTFDVPLPPGLSREERLAIADDIIEFVKSRTENGRNKNGKPFPEYSREYKKSLDFLIGGKTNRVNLTLSGDMLASIQLIRQKKNNLEIGFKAGSSEAERAEGNVRGTYGQKSPISGKARDFLGISKTRAAEIIRRNRNKDTDD